MVFTQVQASSLLTSPDVPVVSYAADDPSVAVALSDVKFPGAPSVATMSAPMSLLLLASLLFIASFMVLTSLLLLVFPPVLASLLLLASPAILGVSCAAVEPAVVVFLLLLFCP